MKNLWKFVYLLIIFFALMDYSALARTYNTLSYKNQLKELLCAFSNTDDFDNLSKHEIVKIINDLIFENYEGEQILKYKLAKEFMKKDYVAAFEVKAKSSRTDFLAVNGDTKSFEVKSKIDTLNRLAKQVNDYGDVFEYNTVVIDKKHLTKIISIIPEYYGIWYFEKDNKKVYRDAKYSPKINSKEQLLLFNKSELKKAFGTSDKELILAENNSVRINQALKSVLKQRYSQRWGFVQNNWDRILPIDIQFFFNTNVKPEIIYGA
jgi:hypothetical protein